jgi:DNA-binding SARP family transcriptional activator
MLDALTDDPAQAAEMLWQLWTEIADGPLSAELVLVALFAAHAALLAGDEAHAIELLLRCVKAADRWVARNIIAAEILNSPKLLMLVESRRDLKPLLATAQTLQQARAAVSDPPRAEGTPASDATFSLRVLTLGDDSIERDGVPVATSEWRSSRAKEFFMYLLFEGPTSREHISLMFWPDSPASKVRSNFHTTLYRARRALGDNVILFENDLYCINPSVSVWCDAVIFRRFVLEARMLPYSDVRADDLYRKAAELYHGEFLASMDADWSTPHREALYDLHISALIGAGHCARTRQEFATAITLFRRVLKVDAFREEAYRAMFTCYAGMGELNSLLKQYNAMSTIFQTELGIKPSPETHAHVQQLTQRIS